jgi:hypothetical protein
MEDVKYVSSTSELHEHIGRNEPCVYRVPQESRLLCQTKWTRDYLTKTIGSKEVTVRKSSSRKYVDPADGFWSLVRAMLVHKMTMMEFIETGVPRGMIMSGTDTYLFHEGVPNPAWAKVWEDAKGLTIGADLAEVPGFFPRGSLHTVGLWVSGAGIKSILHYDDSGDNNVNFQIRGSKRIMLFPPTDWPKLKTIVALSLHDLNVYADLIDDPDKEKQFRMLEGTHPVVAHLQENDVIYIPSRWYHYVKHEGEFNVNMTCWFEREALSAKADADGGITIPQRSCSDYGVVIKMVSAFFVSGLLNFVRKFTGICTPASKSP